MGFIYIHARVSACAARGFATLHVTHFANYEKTEKQEMGVKNVFLLALRVAVFAGLIVLAESGGPAKLAMGPQTIADKVVTPRR
jgi:hypothetical protein